MKIPYKSVSFGADPEFFFTQAGRVVGAEKILPKEGVGIDLISKGDQMAKVLIIDGVQAEFNVLPSTCRQTFSSNLRLCFIKLAEQLQGKDVSASFAQTVQVTPEEMTSLSRKSQQFGCAPSKNAYKKNKISVKDASKYYQRSAGGHIHLGGYFSEEKKFIKENPEKIVPILDIVLGNTCVLLDRDAGNVERRKNYGRAGEYRTPKHGLEYRTLSNFWLRSYQLTSLVLALARFGVSIAFDEKASAELLSLVDMKKIQKAVNENDLELAYANFESIKQFLSSIDAAHNTTGKPFFPLQGARLSRFEFFAEKGIDHWFKEDPLTHWLKVGSLQNGWESFIDILVPEKMPKPSFVQKIEEVFTTQKNA